MKHAERTALEARLSAACDRNATVEEVSTMIAALDHLAQVEKFLAGAPRAELLKLARSVRVSAGKVRNLFELRQLVLELGAPVRAAQLERELARLAKLGLAPATVQP